MKKQRSYFGGIFWGVKTLCVGLKTTMRELFTKKVTEQYPENRDTLKMFDRFRGSLTMPHNDKNEHKCVACHLCEMACPNGTIKVVHDMVETPDGKKQRVLKEYWYNLGTCMFCMLCVNACPHNAITFDQSFENAVFDRKKLILRLNHEGSHVEPRPAVKPRPAAAAAAKPAAAAAAKPAAAAAAKPAAAAAAKPAAPAAASQEAKADAKPAAAPDNAESKPKDN